MEVFVFRLVLILEINVRHNTEYTQCHSVLYQFITYIGTIVACMVRTCRVQNLLRTEGCFRSRFYCDEQLRTGREASYDAHHAHGHAHTYREKKLALAIANITFYIAQYTYSIGTLCSAPFFLLHSILLMRICQSSVADWRKGMSRDRMWPGRRFAGIMAAICQPPRVEKGGEGCAPGRMRYTRICNYSRARRSAQRGPHVAHD